MFDWFKKKQINIKDELTDEAEGLIRESEEIKKVEEERNKIYKDINRVIPYSSPIHYMLKEPICKSKIKSPILEFVKAVKKDKERFQFEIKSSIETDELSVVVTDLKENRKYEIYVFVTGSVLSSNVGRKQHYVPPMSTKEYFSIPKSYGCLSDYSVTVGCNLNIGITLSEVKYLLRELFNKRYTEILVIKKHQLSEKKEQWKLRKELTRLYKGELK